MPNLSDTIFGEMTFPGRSALRSVRVSGQQARRVSGKLFSAKLDPWKKTRTAVKGTLKSLGGSALDTIIIIAYPLPDSFTGEDCLEFHCHGSEGVIRGLSSSLISIGLRKALPGEFSYRAFLSGKMTTEEAEGLGNLIEAETAIEAGAAVSAMPPAFKSKLESVRKKMLSLLAAWEARIDFPEDVPQVDGKFRLKELMDVLEQVKVVHRQIKRSMPVKEGFRIAIFGAPNSGKSSLFNCLLGRERAIVTPHPGTTRDIIEEKLDIEGIPMVFQDTAGARKKGQKIETAGIALALESAGKADAVLFLFDGSKGWRTSDREAYDLLKRKPLFMIASKKDLYTKRKFSIAGKFFEISNKTGDGLEDLITGLQKWGKRNLPEEGLLLLSRRQEECFGKALKCLDEAVKIADKDELYAAEMVKESLHEMDRFTLTSSKEEIYDLIFSGFCIGK
jgi:tRNA modification GTPase